ncbi:phosphonate C-P lyase system protein PhnH [Robertmurraya siralis]|uniref:Phosphonate C-P lyase system protein PhnH n=1 Tax=Robertmurraya siralis TaxID=77777 RepID=A0A919WKD9_9BACI|nr:phosphonate C-P lyase system protein PhnH [Robertmurraya siralis]PAE21220.1 phosphonate C-P lyase system protein PhnH [Bacillus sp. 7504-2]GIN63580.1 phosphonate C-P lyase system protein PhnH [Robertmurraya siralis]
MKLDMVHDIQTVYRKLVDAMARPGQLADLSKEAALIEENEARPFLLLAFTLFDQEVTFKVFSKREAAISKLIHQYTNARPAAIEEADYIFVLADAEKTALKGAIERAKHGTLKNPHDSATIFAEVDEITNTSTLKLTGPGIQSEEQVHVETESEWLAERQVKNKEYPLGVDLMFIDRRQQLLALPRTTQITINRVIV